MENTTDCVGNLMMRDTAHIATTGANALHSCQSTAACESRYRRISRQMLDDPFPGA